jgi:hypothetical protein
MEVLIYLALGILVAPYILMVKAAIKMHIAYSNNQGKTGLDLTDSA